jgi:hypothetical protein
MRIWYNLLDVSLRRYITLHPVRAAYAINQQEGSAENPSCNSIKAIETLLSKTMFSAKQHLPLSNIGSGALLPSSCRGYNILL